jgi:hypothetical protein
MVLRKKKVKRRHSPSTSTLYGAGVAIVPGSLMAACLGSYEFEGSRL